MLNEAAWRNTARTPQILGMDARAVFPVVIFSLHFSMMTFIIAIIGVAFFYILSRYGYTPIIFIRILRLKVTGPYRPVADPAIWRRRVFLASFYPEFTPRQFTAQLRPRTKKGETVDNEDDAYGEDL